jgi:hypothetical protein
MTKATLVRVVIAVTGVLLSASIIWMWYRRRRQLQPTGKSVTFEFGDTEASNAFLHRNQKFLPKFERLMDLANKCFGRQLQPKNRTEDICFGLGHTCREDFMEIVFLCANGYSNAGLKLLRGLYERSVALAYIVKFPEKAVHPAIRRTRRHLT